jgi:hypothetical protein
MKGLGRSWFSFSSVCLLWQGRRHIPELDEEPVALKSMTRFFGGCLCPANFLNRNDSQAQVARWKCPATAMF